MRRWLSTFVCCAVLSTTTSARAEDEDEPIDPGSELPPVWQQSPGCLPGDVDCVCRQRVTSKWKRRALRVKHLFYSCDSKLAWAPAVLYRSEFGLNYGFRLMHRNLYGNGEHARFRLLFNGNQVQYYSIIGGAPRIDRGRYYLTVSAHFSDEGNLLFRGLGNPSETGDGSGLDPREAAVTTRYKKTQIRTNTGFGYNFFGERLRIGPMLIYERQRFGEISPGTGGTSIGEVYDTSKLPGFRDGVDLIQILAEVMVDWRDRLGFYGQGLRARLFGGGAPPLDYYQFWRYGVEAAYSLRIGRYHMISAAVLHEALRGEQTRIPFASEPRLGGVNLLKGYADGTFRDNLAVVGILQYRFPLWSRFVAGSVFVDAGKVGANYRSLTDNWQHGMGGALIVEPWPEFRLQISATQGDDFHIRITTSFSPRLRRRGYFPRY